MSPTSPTSLSCALSFTSHIPPCKTLSNPITSLPSSLSLLINSLLMLEEVSFIVALGQERVSQLICNNIDCHDPRCIVVATKHCPSEGIAYMAAEPFTVFSSLKAGELQHSLSHLVSGQCVIFDPGGSHTCIYLCVFVLSYYT